MRILVWSLVALYGVASLQSTGLADDFHHGHFAHNPSHNERLNFDRHGYSDHSPSHDVGYGSYGSGYGDFGNHNYGQSYSHESYGHGMRWSGSQHFFPSSNYQHGGPSWSNHW